MKSTYLVIAGGWKTVATIKQTQLFHQQNLPSLKETQTAYVRNFLQMGIYLRLEACEVLLGTHQEYRRAGSNEVYS